MKTEDFDDAVRRKIQSVYQPFDQRDADNIHSYVTKKQNSVLSRNKIVVVSLLLFFLLTTAGSLIWNFVQINENKLLSQNNSYLKSALVRTDSLLNAQKNYGSATNDTVYVTKYDTRKEEKFKKQGSLAAKGLFVAKDPNKNSEDRSAENANVSASGKRSDYKIVKQDNDIGSGMENKKESLTDAKKEMLLSKKDTISDLSAETEKTTQTTLNNDTSKKISLIIPEITEEPVNEKRSFSLKNLKYYAGIGIEKGNSQFALSLLSEIQFSEKWSITAGAKYLKVYNEKYNDEDDFRQRNGKNFKDIYSPNSLDTSMASDIDFKYTVIQIPIAINYRVPLKNNFSLLFSCGTDIDVYATKHIKYEYRTPNANRDRRGSDTKDPVLMFNNAVLAIGIQKQWGRFPIQLSLFVSPQINTVEYKKENWYYGIRLRILCKIGKQ